MGFRPSEAEAGQESVEGNVTCCSFLLLISVAEIGKWRRCNESPTNLLIFLVFDLDH